MVAQTNYGLSPDATLGGDNPSDVISPSEKAIKTYVDNNKGADSTLSNVASIDANSAVQVELDTKVNKVGDTMTGVLNINRSGNNFVQLKVEDFTFGTPPSTLRTLSPFQMSDSDNQWFGKFQCQFQKAGGHTMEFSVRNAPGGNKYSKISSGWDANGIAFASAPETDETRTDVKDVVTRGFLNKKLNTKQDALGFTPANNTDVVTLTTDQTITGTKNFTARIKRQSNEVTKGVAPASTVNTVIGFVDQNGDSLGNVYHQYTPEKISGVTLQAVKANASGDSDIAGMSIFYPASGDPYATAPASDVVNSIVTTVNKSKSGTGYFKYGNGMIIQWGTGAISSNVLNITFPTAFTAATYRIMATRRASETTTGDSASIYRRTGTTTTCQLYCLDNVSVDWIAIGY